MNTTFELKDCHLSETIDYLAPLTSPLKGIVSIPHSGELIPKECLPFLTSDRRAVDEDIDYKVPSLIHIDKLRKAGIAIVIAKVHRAAIELNRDEEATLLHWNENTQGVKLVCARPTAKLQEEVIHRYYRPYYALLTTLIRSLEHSYAGKRVPFVDLHSMPSKPTAYHLKLNPNQKSYRADFCISDLKGISCEKEYIQMITTHFSCRGHKPAMNDPYFGGNITKFAAKFTTNAIQIEINRSIYMDEEQKALLPLEITNKIQNDITDGLLQLFAKFSF
ncbi:MAG: N-formylglutamate amidohydrolase [Oligoflexia bacterium]|nr:N-formylglutamate amidohydrolase [Oligoflexia bacterium]